MNIYGMQTLYKKEVTRFLKVYNQTLVAPMINALLLLAVFSLALSDRVGDIQGISLQKFLVPGLIMMTIVQNAFANTSSTLTFGKVLGIIIDVLIPPLSPRDITIAIAFGGMTRGIISGLVVAIGVTVTGFIIDPDLIVDVHNFPLMLFYIILSSMMLSLIGMAAGIYSDSFDQMSAITSFVITPLSFLSGTFYSIKRLPDFWQNINYFNPFFYMIDGFRYSLIGYNDAPIATGMVVLATANVMLFCLVYNMLKKGYKMKS